MSYFLANFLEAMDIDRIDMAVGHSFGCAVLAMSSVLRPGLIAAFTFLSSLGLRPHSAIRPYTGKCLLLRIINNTTSVLQTALPSCVFLIYIAF